MKYSKYLLLFLAFCQITCQTTCQTTPNLEGQEVIAISNTEITVASNQKMPIPDATDAASKVLVIVRHAEKAGGGDNPELLDIGYERANRLASILENFSTKKAYVTNYKRNMFTAMPTTSSKKVGVTMYEAKEYNQLFDMIFADAENNAALLVGHSNTVPQMLNLLLGEAQYEEIDEMTYDRLFVVSTKGLGQSMVLEFKY